ncbi:mucin-4-like [Cynoglossus semilaevis]|uniref:mucin-4-like n=1 Tax=Cynoglossus semilaevis TaxID=244447 RepID=UPI000D624230|nr:mucin-4-like [Cynoglossus semilaevis]
MQIGHTGDFTRAAVTVTPDVGLLLTSQGTTQGPKEKEKNDSQVLTNVTPLEASEEITTVFDYNWTNLPIDSSNKPIEVTNNGLITTGIPDVDEIDPDIISVVKSTPPLLSSQMDKIMTKRPTTGPTHALGVSGNTDISADAVVTTSSQTQVIKSTTSSVQDEGDELWGTPTPVKSESLVAQAETVEELVTFSTEPHSASYKAEVTEDTKSSSATPAAEDSTENIEQTVSPSSSDDATGKTVPTTDLESLTEGEKETLATKEFGISLTSKSTSTPEQTAKTVITGAAIGANTESTRPNKPTQGDISKEIATSHLSSTVSSQIQTENVYTSSPPLHMSPVSSVITTKYSEITLQTVDEQKTSVAATQEPDSPSSIRQQETSSFPSESDLTPASRLHSVIEMVRATVSSFNGIFSQHTTQSSTETNGTGTEATETTQTHETKTKTLITVAFTAISSPFGGTEKTDLISASASVASSLYNTEKPTSLSPQTQQTVTSQTGEGSVTPESTDVTSADTDSSTRQSTDGSTADTAAPTASSLFSTEKPTGLPTSIQESAFTDATETTSDHTEGLSSTAISPEEGSGEQTPHILITPWSNIEKSSSVSPTVPSPQTSDIEDKGSVPAVSVSGGIPNVTSFATITSPLSFSTVPPLSSITATPHTLVLFSQHFTSVETGKTANSKPSVRSDHEVNSSVEFPFVESSTGVGITSEPTSTVSFTDLQSLNYAEVLHGVATTPVSSFSTLSLAPVQAETKKNAETDEMASTPSLFETQPMAIPSVTTVTLNQISTYINMEASGLEDYLGISADGSGAELLTEFVTPSLNTFTAVADEEGHPKSTSGVIRFATQSPYMISTEMAITVDSLSMSSGPTNLSTKSEKVTGSPFIPVTATLMQTSMSFGNVTVTVQSLSDPHSPTNNLDSQTSLLATVSSDKASAEPTETFLGTSTIHSNLDNVFSEASRRTSLAVHNTGVADSTISTVSSIFSTEKIKMSKTSNFNTEQATIKTTYAITPTKSENESLPGTEKSAKVTHIPLTERHITKNTPLTGSILFGKSTGEPETYLSFKPTSAEEVSSQDAESTSVVDSTSGSLASGSVSTSTAIIFTDDVKDKDKLFSAVTDSMNEEVTNAELITKDDSIIDADTLSIQVSSIHLQTIQTEEARGITMTQIIEGTGEADGSRSIPPTYFTSSPKIFSATGKNLDSTTFEHSQPTSKSSVVEHVSTMETSNEDTVTSSLHVTVATLDMTKDTLSSSSTKATPPPVTATPNTPMSSETEAKKLTSDTSNGQSHTTTESKVPDTDTLQTDVSTKLLEGKSTQAPLNKDASPNTNSTDSEAQETSTHAGTSPSDQTASKQKESSGTVTTTQESKTDVSSESSVEQSLKERTDLTTKPISINHTTNVPSTSAQSSSQPDVIVQVVTTVSPVHRPTTPLESFEQVKSEITLTHHPNTDFSSEDVLLTTTNPIFENHVPSQSTKSTTHAVASLVAEPGASAADDRSVEPTPTKNEPFDVNNEDNPPPDYDAPDPNLLECVPQIQETSPGDTNSSSKENATKSPVAAEAVTMLPFASANVISTSGSEPESSFESDSSSSEMFTTHKPNIDSTEKEQSWTTDEIQAVFKADAMKPSFVESVPSENTSGKQDHEEQNTDVSSRTEMPKEIDKEFTTSVAQTKSESTLVQSGATSLSSSSNGATTPSSLTEVQPLVEEEVTTVTPDAELDLGHTVVGEPIEIPGKFSFFWDRLL